MIPCRLSLSLGSVVSLKHRSVNCPGAKESVVLRYSVMKAVEVKKGRADHGDLISVLDVRGRLFSI